MQQTSEDLTQLYAALVKAQGGFLPIVKNREGQDEFGRTFRYADMSELLDKTRPALVKNGLAVLQPIQSRAGGGQELVTILVHESGQMIVAPVNLAEIDSVKQYGGLITFMRRYAYQAILNVSSDDDLDDNPHSGGRAPKADDAPQVEETQFYSQADFDKNLAGWTTAIKTGLKDHAYIIAMVESKAPLTDEQKKTINAIEVAQA